MSLKIIRILSLVVVITGILAAIMAYPALPQTVATHWGADGKVNGYSGKFWGIFMMPIISAVLYAFLMAVPLLDPKKQTIKTFRLFYERFVLGILIFFLYIFSLTLIWNFGYQFNMSRFFASGFSIVLFLIGDLLAHAKPNWTIGIRTPWTLSSVTVWNKTHALGKWLFRAAAVITLVGLAFPAYAFYFLFVSVIGAAIVSVGYSYFLYTKLAVRSKK
jgi:uncharacterized membrane protein